MYLSDEFHSLVLNAGDSLEGIKNRLLIRHVKGIFTNATSTEAGAAKGANKKRGGGEGNPNDHRHLRWARLAPLNFIPTE